MLGKAKGYRACCLYAGICGFAGGGIQAGWNVDREYGEARSIQEIDKPCRITGQLTAHAGAEDLVARGLTDKDVVCGIAASYRTPYVLGAMEKARQMGAKTIYVTCNPRENVKIDVDVAICAVVGPEVVMGSTRMKAGTATKLVLNMLTTASMICMGKIYGNMMVDLMMTSRKLEERSKRTVMMVTGLDYEASAAVLAKAGGHVKTALVMVLANVDADKARKRLAQSDGFVRKAIRCNG